MFKKVLPYHPGPTRGDYPPNPSIRVLLSLVSVSLKLKIKVRLRMSALPGRAIRQQLIYDKSGRDGVRCLNVLRIHKKVVSHLKLPYTAPDCTLPSLWFLAGRDPIVADHFFEITSAEELARYFSISLQHLTMLAFSNTAIRPSWIRRTRPVTPRSPRTAAAPPRGPGASTRTSRSPRGSEASPPARRPSA